MNELRTTDLFDLDPMESTLRSLMRPWRTELDERAPQIRADITEADGHYIVQADVPGVSKDDIDVRVDGKLLTISAEWKEEKEAQPGSRRLRSERRWGFASRTFAMGDELDEAKAEARFENGVLKLTLPKRATASHRRLAIS